MFPQKDLVATLLFFLVVLIGQGYGQERVTIGPHGGLSYIWVDGVEDDEVGPGLCWFAGVQSVFPFGQRMGLQAEANYISMGADASGENYSSKTRLRYVQIMLAPRYQFLGDQAFGLAAFAGLGVDIGTDVLVSAEYEGEKNSETFSYEDWELNPLNLSVVGGLEASYQANQRLTPFAQFRYQYGLLNIYDSDEYSEHTMALMFNLGMRFKL